MAKWVGFNIKKRRSFKKRRFTKKYRGRRVGKSGIAKHYFKRTFVQEATITNAGFVSLNTLGVSVETQLDNLPNYAEFTALYDTYKICAVKRKFMFNRNSADVASANQEIPHLVTANDYTDNTAPANEAELLQYPSFKQSRLDKPVTRYYKPCQLFSSNPIQITKSRWNPTDEPDVRHFGMKMAIDTINSAGGTTLGTLRVYTTLYLAFRSPK